MEIINWVDIEALNLLSGLSCWQITIWFCLDQLMCTSVSNVCTILYYIWFHNSSKSVLMMIQIILITDELILIKKLHNFKRRDHVIRIFRLKRILERMLKHRFKYLQPTVMFYWFCTRRSFALIKAFYQRRSAQIFVYIWETEISFEIRTVLQNCILYPTIFNYEIVWIMGNA